jgi:hypothetical protein
MNKTIGRCGDCKWYESLYQTETGTCCYNPPVVVIDESTCTVWPNTNDEDFCSKWATRRQI